MGTDLKLGKFAVHFPFHSMGTEGIEPPHAALEAASLPLAYAPNELKLLKEICF